ncbi:MAG TPA: response regulator transcription factor [Acidisarcina sp.]
MTVLIVEDNEGIRRLLRRTVAEIATDVWECSDGIDSLEAYTVHRPDIVLMDVRMPKMDGLTATRLILRNHSAARIVMVTDYNDESMRGAALEAGACGYVLKLNLLDLNQLIQTIIDQPNKMPNAAPFGPR